MGSLRADMVVKPTMSLKYNVTSLKCSGLTGLPVFSAWATDLKGQTMDEDPQTNKSNALPFESKHG